MRTPKDNMISQIWGLKVQPLTAEVNYLTLDQSGTLFTNTGATIPIAIELPAINNLRQDNFIQPFYFSPTVNKEMEININSGVGSDRIIIPDYNNNNPAKAVLSIKNILGDDSVYNTDSLIGLFPSKADRWSIAHITGVWTASPYGIFDIFGLKGQNPIIALRKNATQNIGWTNPITWTDVTWQTADYQLWFQWAPGNPAIITAEMSGLADIYVNLEHSVDADGASDGTIMRVMINGSEMPGGKNTLPEYSFIDTTNMRRHLKVVVPDVQIYPGDVIKVQAADNATSGSMTIYNTTHTNIQIKYKR